MTVRDPSGTTERTEMRRNYGQMNPHLGLAPTPASPCRQCREPDLKGIHTCPEHKPASGKKCAYTVDVLKRVLLDAIALTNTMVGAKDQVPGYREAVLALPNRDLLRGLPMEIRSFLERELDALEDA
jgi:hypothetical protein